MYGKLEEAISWWTPEDDLYMYDKKSKRKMYYMYL